MAYHPSLIKEALAVASSLVYLNVPPSEVLSCKEKLDAWKNKIAQRYKRRELCFAQRHTSIEHIAHVKEIASEEITILNQQTVVYLLSLLTECEKEAIMLHYFDDLTVDEIAVGLRISRNSVKSRLKSAMKKMRGALSQEL